MQAPEDRRKAQVIYVLVRERGERGFRDWVKGSKSLPWGRYGYCPQYSNNVMWTEVEKTEEGWIELLASHRIDKRWDQ